MKQIYGYHVIDPGLDSHSRNTKAIPGSLG
mgnify:CR=1 FL=1